jgi:hypothetical protein
LPSTIKIWWKFYSDWMQPCTLNRIQEQCFGELELKTPAVIAVLPWRRVKFSSVHPKKEHWKWVLSWVIWGESANYMAFITAVTHRPPLKRNELRSTKAGGCWFTVARQLHTPDLASHLWVHKGEHLQQCSVCDFAQIFLTFKLVSNVFSKPTPSTITGTVNRCEITNSKPPRPIIMISKPFCWA